MKIFRVLGITVYLDITWFVIFVIFSLILAPLWKNIIVEKNYFPLAYLLSVILVVSLFICLLAHEFAHSIVAKRLGIPVYQITLFFLGGMAHIEKNPEQANQEFKMAIAGPLISLIISGLFYGVYILAIILHFHPILFPFLSYLVLMNFIWAIFNLIPAFPMDGGRILRSILWYFLKNQIKATKIAVWIGTALGLLMIILSIPVFHNPFLILIGIFIIQAGRAELKNLLLREKLKNIKVKMIMSHLDSYDFVSEESTLFDYCSPEEDLWTVYEKMLKTKKFIFKVVENNQVIGRIDWLDINDYLEKTS